MLRGSERKRNEGATVLIYIQIVKWVPVYKVNGWPRGDPFKHPNRRIRENIGKLINNIRVNENLYCKTLRNKEEEDPSGVPQRHVSSPHCFKFGRWIQLMITCVRKEYSGWWYCVIAFAKLLSLSCRHFGNAKHNLNSQWRS